MYLRIALLTLLVGLSSLSAHTQSLTLKKNSNGKTKEIPLSRIREIYHESEGPMEGSVVKWTKDSVYFSTLMITDTIEVQKKKKTREVLVMTDSTLVFATNEISYLRKSSFKKDNRKYEPLVYLAGLAVPATGIFFISGGNQVVSLVYVVGYSLIFRKVVASKYDLEDKWSIVNE